MLVSCVINGTQKFLFWGDIRKVVNYEVGDTKILATVGF